MSAWIPVVATYLTLVPAPQLPEVATAPLQPNPLLQLATADFCAVVGKRADPAPAARPVAELAVSAAVAMPAPSAASVPMLRLAPPRASQSFAMPLVRRPLDAFGEPGRPQTELDRADDGLFYVTGMINGQPVRFLVDTGATTITLTAADAMRVGADRLDGPAWIAETANGRRAMHRVRLGQMAVGAVEAEDVSAAVAPDGLSVSLLGASWLTHLGSMTIEGDRMILR